MALASCRHRTCQLLKHVSTALHGKSEDPDAALQIDMPTLPILVRFAPSISELDMQPAPPSKRLMQLLLLQLVLLPLLLQWVALSPVPQIGLNRYCVLTCCSSLSFRDHWQVHVPHIPHPSPCPPAVPPDAWGFFCFVMIPAHPHVSHHDIVLYNDGRSRHNLNGIVWEAREGHSGFSFRTIAVVHVCRCPCVDSVHHIITPF
jgi:hypothetical protein